MKVTRIDLFTYPKNHQYGVQQAFSKGLSDALNRCKIASSLFAYEELGFGTILAEFTKNRPFCTAGFNVVVGQHSPLEPLAIPHLSMIVDAASYFPELLQNPYTIASFVDEDSVAFFKLLGAKHVFFLPHAIDEKTILSEPSIRDLDIVFASSFIDVDEVIDILKTLLSEKSYLQLMEQAERVLGSATVSPLQAFVELVEAKGSFEEELMQKKLPYFDLMNLFDRYIRAIDRMRILAAIERPVHVFGPKGGWKGNCIFHDPLPFTEMAALFRRAKLVINSVPMFKRGLHERMLLALASGASVITNRSDYVQQLFSDSAALLPYLSTDYKQINEKIEESLKDEEMRFTTAVAIHPILKAQTWDARVEQLLEVLPPHIEAIRKAMVTTL